MATLTPGSSTVPDLIAAIVVVAVTVLAWHGTASDAQATETFALVLGYVFGRGAAGGAGA